MSDDGPIHGCLQRWHQHLRGELDGGLDAILHPDVTFLSPIVFTPQEGREITKLYLTAAGGTLGGDDGDGSSGDGSDAGSGAFRYIKEIAQGHHAMLEFETSIDGKYVNGVDILTCDDDGAITEMKVMIRPLQAIDLVHGQMKAMLERLSG
ncbi:nuclear transport factor 2 family protein [Ilumatobacter sp.]|uniref:nuclear transport factor 2 family protein n=1 Tax=Ilumatobacter sp. TaxID=1967498 RepID=UPI003B5196CA